VPIAAAIAASLRPPRLDLAIAAAPRHPHFSLVRSVHLALAFIISVALLPRYARHISTAPSRHPAFDLARATSCALLTSRP